MPELPEVETVRRGLAPVMENMTVLSLETRRANLRFPFPDNFAERVSGRRIIGLGRRAKYLLIDLDDDMTIIAHLGMSGSFRIEQGGIDTLPGEFHNPRSKDGKHDHVVFHLENGEAACRVIYNDPRRFGFMHLWPRAELDLYPAFAVLGPEPTGNMLDPADLALRLRNRAQPLKGMLLDQSVIAGLGNIYVCEALWRSELSPLRKAATLVEEDGTPRSELVVLTQAIREVIADAIAAGGSSLRDHIQTDGSLGYFQHSFAVYDQEGEPCRRDGCPGTVSRIVQSGRSTFLCATCQK